MTTRWFAAVLGIALGLSVAACSAQDDAPPARYIAGEHYSVVKSGMPLGGDDNRVQVREFFLYSCPHCYHFEPTVNAWAKKLPASVEFRKVPVLFGPPSKIYARMFYTEKALGVFDKLHARIFAAIHEQHKPLRTRKAIRAFFVAHGVDGAAFDKAFDSDAVTQKVKRAGELMRSYKITGVPELVVAGKYKVSGRQAGTNRDMLKVADFLIRNQPTPK